MAAMTQQAVRDLIAGHWSTADARQLYNPKTRKNVVYPAIDYAVWIAFYESGWDPTLHVVDADDDSYGLFMINMKGTLAAERKRKSGLRAADELLRPETNVRVAHEIFSERGWSAWAKTTRDRADAKVLALTNGEGVDPTAAGPITGNANEAGLYPGQLGLEDAVGSASIGALDALRKIAAAVLNAGLWKRIGIAVLGGLLVLVALALVVGGKAPTPARLLAKATK